MRATFEIENTFWPEMRHCCEIYQRGSGWTYAVHRIEEFRLNGCDVEVAAEELNVDPKPVALWEFQNARAVLDRVVLPALIQGFQSQENDFMVKKFLVKSVQYAAEQGGMMVFAEIWHDAAAGLYEGRLYKPRYFRMAPSFPQDEAGESVSLADVVLRVPHPAFVENSDLETVEAGVARIAENLLEREDS